MAEFGDMVSSFFDPTGTNQVQFYQVYAQP